MPLRMLGTSRKPTQESRARSGAWLRELRERQGLSQRELAHKVAAGSYTIVAQLEHGRGRIPPHRWHVWAQALGIEQELFASLASRDGGVVDDAAATHPSAQVYWLQPPVGRRAG